MDLASKRKKDELEEEMSRFEQEISGQLPPPPKPPSFHNAPQNPDFSSEFDGSHNYHAPMIPRHMEQAPYAEGHPEFPRFPHPDPHPMHHGLPHLPPLPPLPQGLPLPDSLQMPANMPQFVPPPMPPVMINPVPVPSTPVIKPPTVPLDNYDPNEAVEDKSGEMGAGGESQRGEKKKAEKRKFVRVGGGQTWEDDTLTDWDANDFRLFCGDLGNEVTDEYLYRAFAKYPSILKAKVVRDKKTKKTKGFGFVSFKDPQDYLKAMREMNGKYVGNRPIKLRKSTWKDRNVEIARKKEKEKKKLGLR